MARISDFKAQMTNGGFRTNQFNCDIIFPQVVQLGSYAGNKVRFLAKSSQMPASTLSSVGVSYRGRPVKFAGEREFQPWTIEVYTDTDFVVRNAFEQWVDTMQRSDATSGAIRPLDYQSDLYARGLDRNDNIVKTYKFFDAFPTEIGQIQMDWESNNQIATFTVTFDFNYFHSEGAEGAVIL